MEDAYLFSWLVGSKIAKLKIQVVSSLQALLEIHAYQSTA